MAEQTGDNSNQGSKKGGPLKTVGVLAVVVVIEAVVICGAFWLAGPPGNADAAGPDSVNVIDTGELPIEVLVLSDKFQNTQSGVAFQYDTEVYIVIAQKHQSEINDTIQTAKVQIATDIATLFRKAQPSQLEEPELSTITRQVQSLLDERFGYDEGEPKVQKVLIRSSRYRTDL